MYLGNIKPTENVESFDHKDGLDIFHIFFVGFLL